jgi:hypothetical protein
MVLAELRRQTIAAQVEILIVTPDRGSLGDADLEGFGATKWILVPGVETSGEAMAAAVRGASAPFVTYAEEHSFFAPDWAERLVSTHAQGHDVVGFAIENANPETLTSWAQLYGQFGPVVAPVTSGVSSFLGGHHVSYRRTLLLEYGDRLAVMLEDECALFLDLRARRISMYIAGDAVSRHINFSSLPVYMYMDYLGQRSFAATRASQAEWGLAKRLAWSAATPIIPFIRMRRSLREVQRTGRSKQLLPQILGPMALGLIAGGVGEFMGYMFGPGRAAAQRAPAELRRMDFLAKGEAISTT